MKNIFAVLAVIVFLFPVVSVFASGEELVSNVAIDQVMDEPMSNEEIGMDEGYGEDAEYFGAEVGGLEDAYSEEGSDVLANAEITNVIAQ